MRQSVSAKSRARAMALFDQEHGQSGLPQSSEVTIYLFDDGGREAQRRLVQQKQARPFDDGARQGHHLLLAARQERDRLPQPAAKCREQIESLIEPTIAARGKPTTMFSNTLRRFKRPRPSCTTAIPCRRTRLAVGSRSAEAPSMAILPEVRMRPKMARIVVVLPAPLVPTRARHSPRDSARSTPKRACVLPYQAQRSRTSSMMALPEIGDPHGRRVEDGSRGAAGNDAPLRESKSMSHSWRTRSTSCSMTSKVNGLRAW